MSDVEKFRLRIERVLGPQADARSDTDKKKRAVINLTPDLFPVPGLLFIMLNEILGIKPFGPAEKLAWLFNFSYQSEPVTVFLQKFGLRLEMPEGTNQGKLIGSLQKCCVIAEQYLAPAVSSQLDDAAITLKNEFHRFDGAYRYFRDSAGETYASPPPEPITRKTAYGTATSSSPFLPMIHGGYLASAMLDSYFSRLEHLLVLLVPFTSLNLKNGELKKFVGSMWGDKFKTIFDITSCQRSKKVYDDLRSVKEAFRNPAAHGGFLKKGASFLFHSAAGAMPVQLTKTNGNYEFRISQIPPATFDEICDILDAAEDFIANSEFSDAFVYANSGLDVPTDDNSRSEYLNVMNTENFEDFLDHKAMEWERYANMDF